MSISQTPVVYIDISAETYTTKEIDIYEIFTPLKSNALYSSCKIYDCEIEKLVADSLDPDKYVAEGAHKLIPKDDTGTKFDVFLYSK